jgi:hypothetical protein
MSITIRSMIDSPRQQAALQPLHRKAQTPFRLTPYWKYEPGPRLTPRWTRLKLAGADMMCQGQGTADSHKGGEIAPDPAFGQGDAIDVRNNANVD